MENCVSVVRQWIEMAYWGDAFSEERSGSIIYSRQVRLPFILSKRMYLVEMCRYSLVCDSLQRIPQREPKQFSPGDKNTGDDEDWKPVYQSR